MPSKRKGDNLTSTKASKVSKLDANKKNKKQVNRKKISPAKLQELESTLNQDVCDSRMLRLIQEIVKTTDLDQSFLVRLLKFSIKVKSRNITQQVLCHQTVDLKSQEGGELLWEAVTAGDESIATLLVQANADVNVCHAEDKRTLIQEVLRSYQIENKEKLVCLMLEHGANVNSVDTEGYTVLHDAILHDRCSSDLVIELLNRGAQVTVNRNTYRDDLFSALCYKPQILPKLIEHERPGEARNQRGVIAIGYLMSSKHNSALKLIRKILDLGVAVDTVNPHGEVFNRSNQSCTLLASALWLKNKDIIKLLLEYGADPNQRLQHRYTPLDLAARIERYTVISRLLLEASASIHNQSSDGSYPIHGACKYRSVRNIHLFLSLGADVNATDNLGQTPLDSMGGIHISDSDRLIIKHLALLTTKGLNIGDRHMNYVNVYNMNRNYYQECLQEFEKMKVTNICDGVSYFSLLSKDISSMMRIMKNSVFTRNFKQKSKVLTNLFPKFSCMLSYSFEIAESQYKILSPILKALWGSLEKLIPDLVIDKIASYVQVNLLPDLKRCHFDFYMNLHKSLKNNGTDIERIL